LTVTKQRNEDGENLDVSEQRSAENPVVARHEEIKMDAQERMSMHALRIKTIVNVKRFCSIHVTK